jgi:hypothetical protein
VGSIEGICRGMELKYELFLKKFKDCPSADFLAENRTTYRWISVKSTKDNYLPVHIKNEPPVRMLEDEDKLCIGYGLSMFDSFENAKDKYFLIYNRKRAKLKEIFKNDHDYIVKLFITEGDGIVNNPNDTGHLTLHESKKAILVNNEIEIFPIFENYE